MKTSITEFLIALSDKIEHIIDEDELARILQSELESLEKNKEYNKPKETLALLKNILKDSILLCEKSEVDTSTIIKNVNKFLVEESIKSNIRDLDKLHTDYDALKAREKNENIESN